MPQGTSKATVPAGLPTPDTRPKLRRSAKAEPPRQRGYRAGARIDDGGGRRAQRIASVASAAFAVAFVIAFLDVPGLSQVEPPSPSSAPAAPVSTPLPDLQISRGFAPSRQLPVLAGGVRWLDPGTGALSGTPYEGVRGAPFVMPDGSVLCVCLERSWTQHGAAVRITLLREMGSREPPTRLMVAEVSTEIDEPRRRGDSISIDLAISPDLATIYVATLVRQPDGLVGDVLAVDRRSGAILDRRALPIPAGLGGPTVAIVRVSPDASQLSVSVWSTPIGRDPADASGVRVFRSAIAAGGLGPFRESRGSGSHSVVVPDCGREGFVLPSVYGALCQEVIDGELRPVLHLVDDDGEQPPIVLPPSLTAYTASELDVQVDAHAGRVFVWSPEQRALARIDVASRTVETSSYGLGYGLGTNVGGDDSAPAADPSSASGAVPRWNDLRGAFDVFNRHTLIGSVDGRQLYAIGTGDASSGGKLPSTGIWVIDAETLKLVDAWPPAAYYGDIARTADGEYLVALGLSGVDEAGDSARWHLSLTFHRISTGQPAAIIGSIGGLSGWSPVLLNASL